MKGLFYLGAQFGAQVLSSGPRCLVRGLGAQFGAWGSIQGPGGRFRGQGLVQGPGARFGAQVLSSGPENDKLSKIVVPKVRKFPRSK